MNNKLAYFADKSAIAALYLARFALGLLWGLETALYSLIIWPFAGAIWLCERFWGVRAGEKLRRAAAPLNAADDTAADAFEILLLAVRLKQADIKTRIARRWRAL